MRALADFLGSDFSGPNLLQLHVPLPFRRLSPVFLCVDRGINANAKNKGYQQTDGDKSMEQVIVHGIQSEGASSPRAADELDLSPDSRFELIWNAAFQ